MPKHHPQVLLIVKGLKSRLSREEFEKRYQERLPLFREVPGLLQKYYSYNPDTETWAGIYLWQSQESVGRYMQSDLRKTIASAYELTDPPQIEIYPIVDVLRASGAIGDAGS